MNMKRLIVVCSAFALGTTLTVHAQQETPGSALKDFGRFSGDFYVFARPLEGQLVKGMPYWADVVTESIQTLADGNRIVKRTTSRVYRDSEGRVRREEDQASGTPTITITDPVASISTTLDPATKTARQTPGLRMFISGGYFESFERAKLQQTIVTPKPAASAAGGRGARGAGAGVSSGVGSGSGRGVGSGADAGTGRGVGAARGGRGAGAARGGGAAVEEQLPDRLIEGVLASGVRRTTTIAKGAIGNEQPIKIVSEEWRSTDLQVLVLTDLNDPRTGRSTYKLLKIVRAEPDSALFRVPAEYTLIGGRGRGTSGR